MMTLPLETLKIDHSSNANYPIFGDLLQSKFIFFIPVNMYPCNLYIKPQNKGEQTKVKPHLKWLEGTSPLLPTRISFELDRSILKIFGCRNFRL